MYKYRGLRKNRGTDPVRRRTGYAYSPLMVIATRFCHQVPLFSKFRRANKLFHDSKNTQQLCNEYYSQLVHN